MRDHASGRLGGLRLGIGAGAAHQLDEQLKRAEETFGTAALEGELARHRDERLLKLEQERMFEGPVWNFLCLEDEIANPGDWRTTVVGQMPVVVARDADGSIAAFENRCAHRG